MIKRSKLIDVPKHLQIMVSTSTSATAGTGLLPSTITLIGWRAVAWLSSNKPGNKFHILQRSKDLW